MNPKPEVRELYVAVPYKWLEHIFHCFPSHVSRELDGKPSVWYSDLIPIWDEVFLAVTRLSAPQCMLHFIVFVNTDPLDQCVYLFHIYSILLLVGIFPILKRFISLFGRQTSQWLPRSEVGQTKVKRQKFQLDLWQGCKERLSHTSHTELYQKRSTWD